MRTRAGALPSFLCERFNILAGKEFTALDFWDASRFEMSPAGHMAIGEGVEESGLPAAPFLLERIDEEMPGKMARKLYFVSSSEADHIECYKIETILMIW